MTDRIQKMLATAGVASRRAVETMIREGRVTVNGRPAEIGQKVGAEDHVCVDGRLIALERKPAAIRVLLFRKRVGELVTRDDPEGRRTIFRKLPPLDTGRWIAVGRLDINTSGLLLLTNDGELARRLMHPSFQIKRQYAVRVLGEVTAEIRAALTQGVQLDDGLARFDRIVRGENEGEENDSANIWWNVTVSQGRNRVVRRLLESQGLQVSRLIRVAYGPIELGRGIRTGSAREATAEELQALLQAVGLAEPVKPKRPPRPPRSSSPRAPKAVAPRRRRQ